MKNRTHVDKKAKKKAFRNSNEIWLEKGVEK